MDTTIVCAYLWSVGLQRGKHDFGRFIGNGTRQFINATRAGEMAYRLGDYVGNGPGYVVRAWSTGRRREPAEKKTTSSHSFSAVKRKANPPHPSFLHVSIVDHFSSRPPFLQPGHISSAMMLLMRGRAAGTRPFRHVRCRPM